MAVVVGTSTAESKLASLEEAKATALDDVKAQLRHAQTQRDDALKEARRPVAAPIVPQKGDDARLRAALDALDNERDANARLRADFERYKRRSNKVLRIPTANENTSIEVQA